MVEEESYTLEMFIADLGGIYSFALGISVITILEVFDWLLLKVWKLWAGRKWCRRSRGQHEVAEKGHKEERDRGGELEVYRRWKEDTERTVTPPPSYGQHIEYRLHSREELI